MKISTYSIVYAGLNPEPYFAAATQVSKPVWAVASSNRENCAKAVISTLEQTVIKNSGISPQILEAGLNESQLTPKLQQMQAEVSLAGAVFDGVSMVQLFAVGNARALVFSNGYLTLRTNDTTEAYEDYLRLNTSDAGAYDRIRFSEGRLKLRKYLGNGMPVFNKIQMKKDDALLLCTERFWHYLSITEMELDYRKSAPQDWLKTMSRRVLMKAGRELDKGNFAVFAAIAEE